MAQEFAKKFYKSKAWKDCRKAYIASVHGLCERCLQRGKHIPGYILHHKILLTATNINDPETTLNHKHLYYVCKNCHESCHGNFTEPIREGLAFTENGDIIKI